MRPTCLIVIGGFCHQQYLEIGKGITYCIWRPQAFEPSFHVMVVQSASNTILHEVLFQALSTFPTLEQLTPLLILALTKHLKAIIYFTKCVVPDQSIEFGGTQHAMLICNQIIKRRTPISIRGGGASALCVESLHLLQGLKTILSIPKKKELKFSSCQWHSNAQLLDSPYRQLV